MSASAVISPIAARLRRLSVSGNNNNAPLEVKDFHKEIKLLEVIGKGYAHLFCPNNREEHLGKCIGPVISRFVSKEWVFTI